MTTPPVYICAPVRTAIGAYGGSLKDIPASGLAGIAIRETLSRAKVAASTVDSIVLGQVIQAGAKMNPARQAAISAGIPVNVPALTVNRVCGSGAQAIASAAQEVLLGYAGCAIAGGMENMDQAPHLATRARWGYRMGDAVLHDSMLHDGLNDAFSGDHSGLVTEDLVDRYNVSREKQDHWALRSQKLFSTAQSSGKFEAEIATVEFDGRKGTVVFRQDEHNRPEATIESLEKLKPAFRTDGTITAGNAPGLNSGAASMIVASARWAEKNAVEPMARLVSVGVGAVEPGLFGLGSIPAVAQALERAGWKTTDVERAEINEAFAAIAIVLVQELGFPEDIVNVEGGSIAHGHPIGATGAVLTTRLIHSMKRDGIRRGLVTLCIGGGQGIALAVELAQ